MFMRAAAALMLIALFSLSSCSKKDSTEVPATGAEASKPEAPASLPAETATAPKAFIHLKNGTRVPGTIVASSRTDMVLAGDDGIERKIPLGQIKSVEYGDTESTPPARPAARTPVPSTPAPKKGAAPPESTAVARAPQQAPERPVDLPPAPAAVTTKTYELPTGSEISVRTNEPIDSETATEGQTFDAQVTRDAKDANGDIVIPRGSNARVVIRSASKGGRFRGASDLVLDLQSVAIRGKHYTIETADVTKQGKSGVGANRRTAEYTGGGAALGAIIGAIAGGGKGAAIGAGAGAGAGALTQILTKGRAIKVPTESVLTFSLDKPLKVTQSQ
jgi:hypothetical protein